VRESLSPKRGRVKSVSDLRQSEPSLQLRLEALPESIAVVRLQLRGWLNEAGVTGRELFEIQLAVTEAFANAVEHPEEPTSHLVELMGTVTNRSVAVSVRDYGRWQYESAREEGGLGLAIIDELMDSVVVEPFEDGTTVTMQRRLANH
jgi:anti-sigma regulatory factor (Ser/Thr protein kinase)